MSVNNPNMDEDTINHDGEDKLTELVSPTTTRRRARSTSLRYVNRPAIFFTGIPENGTLQQSTAMGIGGGGVPSVGAGGTAASGAGYAVNNNATTGNEPEMMGSLIRRKRVTSMPLGAGGDFFAVPGGSNVNAMDGRVRQLSGGGAAGTGTGTLTRQKSPRIGKKKQSSLVQGILRRKQVALDLVAAEGEDDNEDAFQEFFAPLISQEGAADVGAEAVNGTKVTDAGDQDGDKPVTATDDDDDAGDKGTEKPEESPPVKLFKPLQFSEPVKFKNGGGGGHGGGGHGGGGPVPLDENVREYLELQLEGQQKLKRQLDDLVEESAQTSLNYEFQAKIQGIKETQKTVDAETEKLQNALGLERIPVEEQLSMEEEEAKEAVAKKAGAPPEKSIDDVTKQLALIEADPDIKKAGRKDFIWTGILVCILIAFTGVLLGWHTEVDEDYAVYGQVGLACSTQCLGHEDSQNYLRSHSQFETGEFINLWLRLDPNPDEFSRALIQIVGAETGHQKATLELGPPSADEHMTFEEDIEVDSSWDHPHEDHLINVYSVNEGTKLTQTHCTTPCTGNNSETSEFFYGNSSFVAGDYIQLVMLVFPSGNNEVLVNAEIVGVDSGQVKATATFGPSDKGKPEFFTSTIEVGFDNPEEGHVIYVYSSDEELAVEFELSAYTNNNTVLSFTLYASKMTAMAKYSELIAALVMVMVYVFILLETIHRTLVAIFGSMVALFFFFLIHGGETESISTLMLHMEWSTLGLLFGMMVLVGELSQTGVFEWFSVRLLMASKGSFVRLLVLLCLLTALASAFLDNVTTMLLLAPVTIDMASILGVDPRPYLIAEVILSNVGGTATMIGDPPNIIIGSAFDEIGFVDFIVEVLPMIFFFAIPASITLLVYIYNYYLTSTKMPALDVAKLQQTYQIYDEPRLLIAGTVTFFVILIFFLHPVHHKDTAWIALIGAFITIAFTNPHDVQDALRNHVEWDTLLFFAGLFVLVEVCAALGLLQLIGDLLADYIKEQPEDNQLAVAITLIIWVSAITSAFLDNIPYTATMIPVIRILAEELPDTLPIKTLAWALSFGACLGGNGTLLGASANIVTAGISTSRGFEISFLNFFYPGMVVMIVTIALANLYMLVIYVWI